MNALLMLEPSAAAQLEAADLAASYPGAQWRGGQLAVENGIGTIEISGAMVYDKSLIGGFLATILGATLTPELQASLKQAAEDPKVRGVLLKVNSPGGMVAGTEETARLVSELAKSKPVVALVESLSASAAYWVTSAASRIVAQGRTVAIGSVGVIATVETNSDAKRVTLVSSQSPKKRLDPGTEEGRAALQSHIDSLAQVFIDSVAANRGKTPSQVQSGFGQGDMLLADAALAAGMIDQVGSQADALQTLQALIAGHKPSSGSQAAAQTATAEPPQGEHMEQQQVDTAAIQAAATTAERTRIAAILNLEEAKGREQLAHQLALAPGMTADTAQGILAATPKATASPLAAAMPPNPNVKPGAHSEGSEPSLAQLIAEDLALAGHAPKKEDK